MQTSAILYPRHWLYRDNVTDFNVQLNFSTQTQTHECRHAHTRTHARTYAHTHTYAHTCTHTHAHTHMHTHTHTSYTSVRGVEGLGILCPESPCYEATKTPHSDTVGQVKYSDHYTKQNLHLTPWIQLVSDTSRLNLDALVILELSKCMSA